MPRRSPATSERVEETWFSLDSGSTKFVYGTKNLEDRNPPRPHLVIFWLDHDLSLE
jgi:hypothetical protein